MFKKSIAAVSAILVLSLVILDSYFETTEAALASGVIRLHVVANSDSDEDQKLKLKVRDRIINEMSGIFDENGSISTARENIITSIDTIKLSAEDEIRRNGYSYTVRVILDKSNFPTKDYGNVILPAGSYEALKIEIGDAKGKNWWCVLFPPLCFVDESCVTADSSAARKIEKSIGEDNAVLVSKNKQKNAQIKFKTYEIWQRSKQKLAMLFGQ